MRLRAARQVDRVPPQIVDKFFLPNDAGDHRPRANADAHLQFRAALAVEALHGGVHAQGHSRRRKGVIPMRKRHTGRSHIRVSSRFDLLDAMQIGEFIECGKHLIQQLNEGARRGLRRKAREADQIREQHRDFFETVHDPLFAVLEARGDRVRQNVEEQPIRARTLIFDLPQIDLLTLSQPFFSSVASTRDLSRIGSKGFAR